MDDLSKCPNCGGPADNGHDRCYPPNPYYCSKCEAQENAVGKDDLVERLQSLIDNIAGTSSVPINKMKIACDARDEIARLTAENAELRAERDAALDLLAIVFSAVENGDQCYENPDECEGYLGAAVHLDDDTFRKCADLLNRLRPNAAIAAKGST